MVPSRASSATSARPTATELAVILRTSPGCARKRCRSAAASRAIAWPTSSTRASATRSVKVAPPALPHERYLRKAYGSRQPCCFRGPSLCSLLNSFPTRLLRPAAYLPRSTIHDFHYDLFDVFNVPPHGHLGSLRIASLDRAQDAPVPG